MDIKVKKNTSKLVACLRQKAAAKLEARRTRAVADEPRMTPCSASGSYIHEKNGGAALAALAHKRMANNFSCQEEYKLIAHIKHVAVFGWGTQVQMCVFWLCT